MLFNRIRITGFKSFVDPTEIVVEPGLTGVVGPNGCGKSNLVEALRWVMGETSAKRMRGSAMDEVIFSGTASRPARNVAEVSLALDNAERRAPTMFNDTDELEVSRRITRDGGSTYRVNGREVRARDVQLLFADLATGAQSTALVSQGRVGALINAKPTERRILIEEAAGITGLHSRRHEAELRLRAAETNLERLDDVIAALETQLQGLKRQARQATRYRNISSHIRRAEATLFHLRWTAAEEALRSAREQLAGCETEVGELTRAAAAASTRQSEAAEALPPLRQAEAEAGAALHRLAVARDGLDAEERRAREAQDELRRRLVLIGEDLAREERHRAEAGDALARLAAESATLEAAQRDEAPAEAAAEDRLGEAERAVAKAQAEVDEIADRAAQETARRLAVAQRIAETGRRIVRLEARVQEIARERDSLAETTGEADATAAAAAELAAAQAESETADAEASRAELLRAEAQKEEDRVREVLQEAETAVARLRAEERALAALVAAGDGGAWPPVVDSLVVEPGYESALGAALGSDLDIPADESAPVHWKALAPYAEAPPLPAGAEPLSRFVEAPAALARRLAQIGVVETEADGSRLAEALAQGQRLVSRDGALWRWDGLTARADADTPAAARLAQRNRLAEVRRDLADAAARMDAVRSEFESARAATRRARERENAARETARRADRRLAEAREARSRAEAAKVARDSRLAILADAAERVAAELEEARARLDDAERERAALPADGATKDEVAARRRELERLRGLAAEARARRDELRREAAERTRRLAQIAEERVLWSSRADDAARQVDSLLARRATAAEELAALEGRPDEIASQRAAILDRLAAAEAERGRAGDAVAEAERRLAACDKAVRETGRALAEARERRVRLEAGAEHASDQLASIVTRIREEHGCPPAEVLAGAGIDALDPRPNPEDVERRLERLKRERDNMGPVNLRADIEAAEVVEQLDSMTSERADLEAAIGRLRQGIAGLNREGRQRLLAAFREVDGHFQTLFVRVFGGGEAHLRLADSEDPLEAGLEIMASPPGKRLQNMSLLSGGEQALTALSLLFAVFLTRPAPICVLDEVDAPLDDANVERLCGLLVELAEGSGTRFLVVTHNPITMSRMDRLYGVTMAERGVSQLVSVDLGTAQALRESA